MSNAVYELTFGFFEKLVDMCKNVFEFLFKEITIGNNNFSIWTLIGATLFTTFLLMWLIKKLI